MILRHASLLACAMACAACGSGAPDQPLPPDSDRAALRAALREQLGDAYDEVIAPPSAAQLEAGARLYAQMCASCHGATGLGDGPAAKALVAPPGDLSDPVRAAFLSDRARLQIVRDGIPGTPMVGWQAVLDDGQVLEVFHHVRSLVASPRNDG